MTSCMEIGEGFLFRMSLLPSGRLLSRKGLLSQEGLFSREGLLNKESSLFKKDFLWSLSKDGLRTRGPPD